MVDVSTNVYVLLQEQIMKEQSSRKGEVRQIPHLEEVENHDLFQCSHIMREVGGKEALL